MLKPFQPAAELFPMRAAMKPIILPLLITPFALLACDSQPAKTQENFTANIQSLCGQAFAGRLVTDDPEDAAWRDADIKMHMFECAEGEVKIALHVGQHRSMTWVVSGEGDAVSLRHDHRQKDGSPHALTDFGGTAEAVTNTRAEFPANPQSIETFEKLGMSDATGRKWALELQSERGVFAYERQRPEHFFRIEFDTTTPIPTPATGWGW